MKLKLIALLAVVAGVVAIAVGAVATSADAGPRAGKRATVVNAAATYLGLTPRALIAELRTGKSLAQVTAARGKSVEGLKQALRAAFDARLSRAVAAGLITAEQKARRLARVQTRLERLVNRVWRADAAGRAGESRLRHGMRATVVSGAATYLGVTPRALIRELRTGKSLAQVTVARGKSVDGLKQALRAAFDARLSRAVAAGRITAEQKARLLARAEARLDRLVARVWRARG